MTKQTPEEIQALEDKAKAEGCKLMVEVIADGSGKFYSNGLRFETGEAASKYASDLFGRWTAVRDYRVAIAPKEEAKPEVEKGT